jgi:hypothetical protein
MSERPHNRSSTSVLLLLSAVDMLCAALVCAVVLFVVLVGGEAREEATVAGGTMTAPSLIQIYSQVGNSMPIALASGIRRIDGPATVPVEDPYLTALLTDNRADYIEYILPPGTRLVTFKSVRHPFYLEMYPGAGRPVRLLVGCDHMDELLAVSLAGLAQSIGQCPASDHGVLHFPIPRAHPIQVKISISSSGDVPPELSQGQWENVKVDFGLENRQILTLRTQSPKPSLSGPSRIVELMD